VTTNRLQDDAFPCVLVEVMVIYRHMIFVFKFEG